MVSYSCTPAQFCGFLKKYVFFLPIYHVCVTADKVYSLDFFLLLDIIFSPVRATVLSQCICVNKHCSDKTSYAKYKSKANVCFKYLNQ